ncbi:MAG: phage protein Gp36 family protein [Terriglobia bacterium]
MSYAQISDLSARYPNRDLVQLTNEDPTQQTIRTAYLQTALDDASAEIDNLAGGPLSAPDSVVTRLCCDIAMYRMMQLRPLYDIKDARQRYDDAVAVLKTMAPALSADPNQSIQTATGDTTSARMFTRKTMRGL